MLPGADAMGRVLHKSIELWREIHSRWNISYGDLEDHKDIMARLNQISFLALDTPFTDYNQMRVAHSKELEVDKKIMLARLKEAGIGIEVES